MTIIFKCKTHDGYCTKILAELLQHNIKTACFEVDKKGISLCMMNHHRTILVNLYLDSDNFSLYKFKSDKKMFLGINLSHFHKMLKMIKKKDSIQLFIDDKNPTDLGIKVIPKENNRITTSFVKIQDIQNIEIDLPEGYSKPVIVSSPEFQKMVKDLGQISSIVDVVSHGFNIRFKCDAGGVMKRHVDFGENELSDDSDDEITNRDNVYTQQFKTEQFIRITKLAGLNSTLQIYPKNGLPLLLRSQVGSLGRISIYLKSISQIEAESCGPDPDENDEDF